MVRLGPRRRGHERAGAHLRARTLSRKIRRRSRRRSRGPCTSKRSTCPRRAWRRRPRWRRSARPSATTAPPIPTANPIRTTFAPCSATSPVRPTSSPIPATRRRSRRRWNGPARSAPRWRRSGRLQRLRRRRTCGRPQRRDHRSTCATSTRCAKSIPSSRAARIEGGALGPALEAQLKPHGLTLRHFPQSFEYSTLGGWIATRSGGHFASLYTHIDDLVETLRVVTPSGVARDRGACQAPARGRAPTACSSAPRACSASSPQAWMRVQAKPTYRAGASLRFPSFFAAARAVRAFSQAGLYPANCRILDPREAYNTGAGDGGSAIMVLAFESADHPLEAWMARALECCADHGGVAEWSPTRIATAQRALWRNAFIRMPYAREFLTPAGLIVDTFETAITWERFEALHDAVKAATERAILRRDGRDRRGHLPLHPRLSRRPRAVLLLPRARPARRAARAMARDQGRGERRAHRGRRHDHPPPRGRARPPALVRPAAAGAVRHGAAGGEARARPARRLDPRRADRSVTGARRGLLDASRPTQIAAASPWKANARSFR